MKKFQYRPEITGLRFFAILPVIFFHSENINFFHYGYLGVDVFFLISGYLITSKIVDQLDNESFKLKNFYIDRIRRLYPALISMVLLTYPLFINTYYPDDLQFLEKSIPYIIFYLPNIFFAGNVSYFDIDSKLNPYLHTWSLGVEEQFYILFPLILLVIYRLKRKYFALFLAFGISIIFVLTISSFTLDQKFYLLPFRMWEFLLGAIIALYLYGKEINCKGSLISSTGLLIVLLCCNGFIYEYFKEIYFLYTFICLLGVSLVILFTEKNSTIYKILSFKPIYIIGLISYSLYLWHQPIYVYLKYQNINIFSNLILNEFAIIFALLFVSYLSWKFVETPIRSKKIFSNKTFIFLSILLNFTLLFLSINNTATAYSLEKYKSLDMPSVVTSENFIDKKDISNTTTTTVKQDTTTTTVKQDTTTTTVKQDTIVHDNTVFQTLVNKHINGEKAYISSENILSSKGPRDEDYVNKCLIIDELSTIDISFCTKDYDVEKFNVLFLGDSLSHNLVWDFKSLTDNEETSVSLLAVTGCVPFIDSYDYKFSGRKEKCEDSYKLINKNIKEYKYDLIFFTYHYIYLQNPEKYEHINKNSYDIFVEKLLELKQLQENLVVIGQFPEYKKTGRNVLLGEKEENDNLDLLSENYLDKDIFLINKKLDTFVSKNNINFINLLDILCFEESCLRVINIEDEYFLLTHDTVHFSQKGSKLVTSQLLMKFYNN